MPDSFNVSSARRFEVINSRHRRPPVTLNLVRIKNGPIETCHAPDDRSDKRVLAAGLELLLAQRTSTLSNPVENVGRSSGHSTPPSLSSMKVAQGTLPASKPEMSFK